MLINLLENANALTSGPGIDLLIAKVQEMANRGAPNEYNNYGFNKSDYDSYIRLVAKGVFTSKEIQVSYAIQMLTILSHYQKTQVLDYTKINQAVKEDVKKISSSNHDEEKIMVFNRSSLEYEKMKVYVPGGIDRSMIIQINKILDLQFKEEGSQKVIDNYGKEGYPRYRLFSVDKSGVNLYRIHSKVISKIIDFLKLRKYEVEYESGKEPAITNNITPTFQKIVDIVIVRKEKTGYGNKLVVQFNSEKSKNLYNKMRDLSLAPKAIAYGGSGVFHINIDDKSSFIAVTEALKNMEFDISPLEEFSKNHFTEKQEEKKIEDQNSITFKDLNENAIDVKVDYRVLTKKRKEFIKECIQYTFPGYIWSGHPEYKYKISGTYKQFISFGRILKKFDFDVDELREILKKKLADGRLIKTSWEGSFDEDKKFISSIDSNFPKSNFDLYDEQKFGIAFLYGRDSAILGDATGLGKSIMLISAAALRMKSNPKPTLIITLKSIQKQFALEIVRAMGEDERSQISFDPQNPKKWTIIYYEKFSQGNEIEKNIESLIKTNFGIVVFDELHKVKHGQSKRSRNIARIIKDIPTKWGASATVSSNKPLDVKNQLEMINHPLGKIDKKKFKRDFTAEGKVENSEEEEIKAAERLNKWLNLSGVYVRREKDELREMPSLSINDEQTSIDSKEFHQKMQATLSNYKNPNLPISRLIAAREVIARLKTNETTKKVLNIIKNGEGKNPAASKVVVFTNFVDAAKLLVSKIKSEIESVNANYKVVTYLANTSRIDKDKVKEIFTNNPNIKVLVMSMKMGGTGIDFPNAAQNMVINDFDWTPESADQSEGRIYRINTDHPVFITYVVGAGFDKDLFDKVKRKREIAAIIQKYRKEYHETDSQEALNKIIDAQKEIKKIDSQMSATIAAIIPGIDGTMTESFKYFLENIEAFDIMEI